MIPHWPDPHALALARQVGDDPAREVELLLLRLWWGWGLLVHDAPPDDQLGRCGAVEVWAPDAAPHVGRPASECPRCAATIEQQAALMEQGLPPTGLVAPPREARANPLLP